MRLSSLKRTVMATALAVGAAVGGAAGQAHALQFNAGDAVLVLYGNATQYYRNLGSEATLISSGANFTIDSGIMSQLGTLNTVQYTIIGANSANFGSNPTDIFAGSKIPNTNTSPINGWSSTQLNGINTQTYWNAIVNWQGQVSTIAGTDHTLPASDTKSFTSFFGTSNTLGGAFPRQMSNSLDATLYLLGRPFTGTGSQLSGLGTAFLNSTTGQFTFAPAAVPVPAAVVLFGSGLIGLVGLARRARV